MTGPANKLWTLIKETIFPLNCLICQQPGSWLCSKCQKKIDYINSNSCPFCHKLTKNGQTCPNCKRNHYLDGLISACYFNLVIKKLIYQYKYKEARDINQLLSQIMLKKLSGHQLIKERKFTIAPIPLHPITKAKRGFNQVQLISQNLANKLNLNHQPKLLKRVKLTKTQAKLTRQERERNIRNAFDLDNKIYSIKKDVLLIDDVFTTGSTLEEAAKTIKKTSNRQVWGAVVTKR